MKKETTFEDACEALQLMNKSKMAYSNKQSSIINSSNSTLLSEEDQKKYDELSRRIVIVYKEIISFLIKTSSLYVDLYKTNKFLSEISIPIEVRPRELILNDKNKELIDMIKKERLASKWKVTGLLDGLSNKKDKENCAVYLEGIASLLINKCDCEKVPEGKIQTIAGIILPVVVRIFRDKSDLQRMPSFEWLYDDLSKFLDENKHLMDGNENEAKVTGDYCDSIIKRLPFY